MTAQLEQYRFGEQTANQLAETTTMTRGERSREWLALFFETAKAAEILAGTDFVPASMKGKPAQVAASMMKGYELDIDPLDALGNIYSVHGRIGFYAEFMRRRILQAGHELRIVESSDTRVVMEGRRRGSDEWQRASFTAAQAKNAKIDLGGYPEDKLVARATSRLCKRVFPDVLSGAAIVEDLLDEPDPQPLRVVAERAEEPTEPVQAVVAQRRRQPRKTPARSVQPRPAEPADAGEEPDLPGDEPAEKPSRAGDQPCTREQQTKLNILLEGEEAIGKDRGKKLEYLAAQFGRPFDSSKDLTLHEASQLIEFLEKEQAGDSSEPDLEDEGTQQ